MRSSPPLAYTVVLLSATFVVGLAAIFYIELTATAVAEQERASRLIARILVFLSAALPVVISLWALSGGKKWSHVGVTVACSWALVLVLPASAVLSTLALVATTAAAIGVWMPSTRKYAIAQRNARAP